MGQGSLLSLILSVLYIASLICIFEIRALSELKTVDFNYFILFSILGPRVEVSVILYVTVTK